jgi:ABC-type sugar transport system substrate-binding protein
MTLRHWKVLGCAAFALALTSGCTRGPGGGTETAQAPGANATAPGPAPASAPAGKKRSIRFIFKVSGLAYGAACERGMQEAAQKIGVDAKFLAPDSADPLKQNNMIEDQINPSIDAVVISPNDAEAVKPVIAKGIEKGVKMFTWDSDAPTSRRIFYVAAADDVGIGRDIADALAKSIGGKGKVAIMSGGRAAYNLNQHVKGMQEGFKKYPGITVIDPILYNDDDKSKAISQAVTILQKYPDLAGIACANSPSPPGAAQALIQTGKAGAVKVWGLSLPSENKEYLKKGIVTGLKLWDPAKLTGLTTILVNDALNGKSPKDGEEIPGYGKISVKGPVVLMPGLTITKENVDQLNF